MTAQAQAAPRSFRRVALVLVAVLAVLLLAGIGLTAYLLRDAPDEQPAVASAVGQAVSRAGNGGTVDFRELTTFEWDRMYAFPAYTDDAAVSEVLGFPWGTDAVLRLPSEQFVLLIFARATRVTGWVVLNDYESTWPTVRFEESLFDKPIARDVSVFEVNGYTLRLSSPQ